MARKMRDERMWARETGRKSALKIEARDAEARKSGGDSALKRDG